MHMQELSSPWLRVEDSFEEKKSLHDLEDSRSFSHKSL